MNQRRNITDQKRPPRVTYRSVARGITHEYVRSVLNYDPLTGFLTWKTQASNRVKAGDRAGWKSKGYREICLREASFYEHRIVWFHVFGEWPFEQLDHINGDRSDNRISNLRECSPSENRHNLTGVRSKGSGFRGVWLRRCNKKWCAAIQTDGMRLNLGSFDTQEAAHAVYLQAKRLIHPFQPIPRDMSALARDTAGMNREVLK